MTTTLRASALRCTVLFYLCLHFSFSVLAQNPIEIEEFLRLVGANHPLAQQANLLTQEAQANLLASRGLFDPKFMVDYDEKHFGGKRYFGYGEAALKMPTTLYGLELKTGYNIARGDFLNPEDRLPAQGQGVIGFSMPLIQGFMMDENRNRLGQARIGVNFLEAERRAQFNDLALFANEVYWKWSFAYREVQVFETALNVAQKRFEIVRQAYFLGDRMAMDTLESFTQVQDRTIQYNEVMLNYQEATLKFYNFLWTNNNTPVPTDLRDRTPMAIGDRVMVNVPTEERTALLTELRSNHPLLNEYAFKLDQLELERRLKREKLKPALNLNYNVLGTGLAVNNLFVDNYKFGVHFSTSTLFREGRGNVELANIKIKNTELMRNQKSLELENKLQLAYQTLDNLQVQISTYSSAVENFKKLLELENRRFELGESSFFLINSRETKYLEAQIKLAKLQAEYQIARASVYWAAGRLTL